MHCPQGSGQPVALVPRVQWVVRYRAQGHSNCGCGHGKMMFNYFSCPNFFLRGLKPSTVGHGCLLLGCNGLAMFEIHNTLNMRGFFVFGQRALKHLSDRSTTKDKEGRCEESFFYWVWTIIIPQVEDAVMRWSPLTIGVTHHSVKVTHTHQDREKQSWHRLIKREDIIWALFMLRWASACSIICLVSLPEEVW